MALINEIPFHSQQRSQITELIEELERAVIVEPTEMPKNVVTMNSHIDVEDIDSGKITTLHLVYPEDADISKQKVSVFSPIGTAIVGYGLGDIIEWPVPSGVKQFKIKDIHYQPEASGDYHL